MRVSEDSSRMEMSLLNKAFILGTVAVISFGLGLFYSMSSTAAESKPAPRIVYPKKTEVDLEGMAIQGEVRNPGEFYFQRRPEEKFDSLVKRRKNFHKEMLRDVVMSK